MTKYKCIYFLKSCLKQLEALRMRRCKECTRKLSTGVRVAVEYTSYLSDCDWHGPGASRISNTCIDKIELTTFVHTCYTSYLYPIKRHQSKVTLTYACSKLGEKCVMYQPPRTTCSSLYHRSKSL